MQANITRTPGAQDAIPRLVAFLTRVQSSFYAIVLFVLYVLCFVYMDSTLHANTEQLCIIMFLGLHIILLLYFVLAAKGNPTATSNARFCLVDLPSTLRAYWSGTIPLAPMFLISWVLMTAAFSLFVQMYVKLHARFTKDNRPVDLGGNGHVQQKESIKQMLIANTVLLWVLLYTIFGTFTDQVTGQRVVGYPGKCRISNEAYTSFPASSPKGTGLRPPFRDPLWSTATRSPSWTPTWISYVLQRYSYLNRIVLSMVESYTFVRPYAEWTGFVSISLTTLILSSLTVWKAQQLALDMGTITDPSG